MRRWRSFDVVEVDGYPVRMWGTPEHIRRGMVCFVESSEYLPPEMDPIDGGAVLCTSALAGQVALRGHVPISCERPRERFYQLFKELPYHEPKIEVEGDLARTAVIGSRAFKLHDGRLLANHGGVQVGRGASVGEGACVDCGVFGEYTEIHAGAHVDNLVHVGHSAVIGARSVVAASAIIGGWAVVGADCWIGVGAAIRDNISIGDRAKIGMGAVVVGDVPDGAIVYGNPARIHGWAHD